MKKRILITTAAIATSIIGLVGCGGKNDNKSTETTTSTEATTTTAETTTTTQEPETTTIEETTQQNTETSEKYLPQTQATYDHSDAKEYTYILNTSTHKFHRNGCDQISKIKPKNYSTFTGTREQAISNGYSPCKKCKP